MSRTDRPTVGPAINTHIKAETREDSGNLVHPETGNEPGSDGRGVAGIFEGTHSAFESQADAGVQAPRLTRTHPRDEASDRTATSFDDAADPVGCRHAWKPETPEPRRTSGQMPDGRRHAAAPEATEGIQVVASLRLDGQALEFGHGVLVQSAEEPGDAWDVFLFDVSGESLTHINAEGEAKLLTDAGDRVTGRVCNDPVDRRLDFVRLTSHDTAV